MPPISFGTTWRHVGTFRRYGHDLPLWLAEPTQAYSDAYKAMRGALVGAGFSWTDRGHEHSHLMPAWWDIGATVDVVALQVEVDRVVAAAAASREEKARASAERLAREIAEVRPAAALIRTQLAALLQERPWALGRHLSDARELAASDDWTRYGLACADRYLYNATGNIERANERLNKVPPAVWFAKADDPVIRAAALQACRVLSERDTDWAAVRNAEGWSQATCWTGHVLSERDALDQGEAAHALALLHGHRKQLPDELQLALFGEVARRPRARRADPDAPSLGL